MSKQDVFDAVMRERLYQDAKWGTIDQHPHSVGEWLLVAESELLEAKQAWCKGSGDYDALVELLQVVAVGVACLEQHGVIERPLRPDLPERQSVLALLHYSDVVRRTNPALADAVRDALAEHTP